MPKQKTVSKAKAQKAQDKAKTEQKKKVVEDKTFGLKNKNKSAKVQKYIQTQLQNAQNQNLKQRPVEDKKEKKKLEAERQKELDDLFKVVVKQPKVPVGVDPKSIVCELFRHGQCTKGFKCKYSHDLSVERKAEKIDLYTDQRDQEDTMEDWDQEKLEKVVEEKHGADNKKSNATTIICKYFLEAVEKKQYGWFWKCPNGKECIYRHALPPGYVLKSQMSELLEEEGQKVDVSEEIEAARQKVDAKTRITEEVFKQWRAKKVAAKEEKLRKETEERVRKGILNGREIFLEAGFVATDDASASEAYAREEDVEEAIRQMEADTKRVQEELDDKTDGQGRSSSSALGGGNDAEDAQDSDFEDEDDDMDPDELQKLEAELETEIKLCKD